MKEVITFYCKDKITRDNLNKESNKSDLITSLLKNYYNKSLPELKREKRDLLKSLEIIQNQIDIVNNENLTKEENTISFEIIIKEKEHFKQINDKLQELYNTDKIDPDLYFSFYENGKLLLSKAEEFVNGLEE